MSVATTLACSRANRGQRARDEDDAEQTRAANAAALGQTNRRHLGDAARREGVPEHVHRADQHDGRRRRSRTCGALVQHSARRSPTSSKTASPAADGGSGFRRAREGLLAVQCLVGAVEMAARPPFAVDAVRRLPEMCFRPFGDVCRAVEHTGHRRSRTSSRSAVIRAFGEAVPTSRSCRRRTAARAARSSPPRRDVQRTNAFVLCASRRSTASSSRCGTPVVPMRQEVNLAAAATVLSTLQAFDFGALSASALLDEETRSPPRRDGQTNIGKSRGRWPRWSAMTSSLRLQAMASGFDLRLAWQRAGARRRRRRRIARRARVHARGGGATEQQRRTGRPAATGANLERAGSFRPPPKPQEGLQRIAQRTGLAVRRRTACDAVRRRDCRTEEKKKAGASAPREAASDPRIQKQHHRVRAAAGCSLDEQRAALHGAAATASWLTCAPPRPRRLPQQAPAAAAPAAADATDDAFVARLAAAVDGAAGDGAGAARARLRRR